MPRGPHDRARVASVRSVARLACDLFGAWSAGGFDAAARGRAARELERGSHPRTGKGISPKQARRVLSLLDACAEAVGGPARRARRSQVSRRCGSRGAPPPPSPAAVELLMRHLPPTGRKALCLAAGAGLFSAEILGITTADFDWGRRRVRIRAGSARGTGQPATRWVAPAAWAWRVLTTLVPPDGPDRLLFPSRWPGRPLARLDRLLRRASRRAFGEEAPGLTLLAARRLHQSVNSGLCLPRPVIAGSIRESRPTRHSRRTLLRWRGLQERAAEAWTDLTRPPRRSAFETSSSPVVPAPPGRAAGREGSARRRRPVWSGDGPAMVPSPSARGASPPEYQATAAPDPGRLSHQPAGDSGGPAPRRRLTPSLMGPTAPPPVRRSPSAAGAVERRQTGRQPQHGRQLEVARQSEVARQIEAARLQGRHEGRFEVGAVVAGVAVLRASVGGALDIDALRQSLPGAPDEFFETVQAFMEAPPKAAPVARPSLPVYPGFSYLNWPPTRQ